MIIATVDWSIFLFISAITLLVFSSGFSYTVYTGTAMPSNPEMRPFMTRNQDLINKTVEITVAKLSNSNASANKDGGERVAEFMQEIYNKLVNLSEKEN